MDIHTIILNCHGTEIMRDLVAGGLSATQAHLCLQCSVDTILDAVDCHGLTRLLSLWEAQQASSLLPFIDMQKLADRLDGNLQLAMDGLNILIPRIIELLRSDPVLRGALRQPGFTSRPP